MKKKENKFFWGATICTLLIIILCLKYYIQKMNEPVMEYSIQSLIGVSAGDKKLIDKKYNIEQIKNSYNNTGVDIKITNENERDIQYEIAAFVNYKQVPLVVDGENMESLILNINQGFTETKTISIDDKNFDYELNDFFIVIRQDTDIHTSENQLLSDSNTIVREYLINNSTVKNNSLFDETAECVKEINNSNDSLLIRLLNREENYKVSVNHNEKVKFKLDWNITTNINKYVVICILNSKQVLINNKEYEILDTADNSKVEIESPELKGKYEVEFFAIPYVLYDNNVSGDGLGVLSSNRYTLEVK